MLKDVKHDTEPGAVATGSNAQVDWSPGYGARFPFQNGSRVRKIVKAQINLREHLAIMITWPVCIESGSTHERSLPVRWTSQPLIEYCSEQLAWFFELASAASAH